MAGGRSAIGAVTVLYAVHGPGVPRVEVGKHQANMSLQSGPMEPPLLRPDVTTDYSRERRCSRAGLTQPCLQSEGRGLRAKPEGELGWNVPLGEAPSGLAFPNP